MMEPAAVIPSLRIAVVLMFAAAACAQAPVDMSVKKIDRDPRTGLELWETSHIGRLWIPGPGEDVIAHLQWEQMGQKVYDHPQARVRAGDIVIDCGAHIGGFTRVALRAGARTVVAVEPQQANILAFRKNFEEELKKEQVILISKGVWDRTGKLALHLAPSGDSHSVVFKSAGEDEYIDAVTIDELVEGLKLPKVDFIKMDIEGSELKALQGARRTIQTLHPRLAISSYHQPGDPAAICALIWQMRSDYLVASKDLLNPGKPTAVPKVLFFYGLDKRIRD
jgi:FkbM family methyltransferase